MTSKWVVKHKPVPGAQLRMICLPFAGGGSNSFRSWIPILPQSIELIAIEIPGRGQRLNEPLRRRITNLVPDIADALKDELNIPFVMFGHSMGTLLGYELAHFLHDHQGAIVQHLFVSGRGAAHIASREKPIHQLSDDEFLQQIVNYNGTPKEVIEHAELMELMLPVLRADFEVCETYNYTENKPLNCPITAMGGLQDTGAPREDMEAWGQHTTADFNLRMLPGDHFYLLNQTYPVVQSMLRDINQHFTLNL